MSMDSYKERYYKEHKEHILQQHKVYYSLHSVSIKKKRREENKLYYSLHKKTIQKKNRERYRVKKILPFLVFIMSHKKDVLIKTQEKKAYMKNYWTVNAEALRKQRGIYYKKNKEMILKKDRERKKWKKLAPQLILLEETLSRIEKEVNALS